MDDNEIRLNGRINSELSTRLHDCNLAMPMWGTISDISVTLHGVSVKTIKSTLDLQFAYVVFEPSKVIIDVY